MISNEIIAKIDTQNMFEVIKNFPSQVKDAIKIGELVPELACPIKKVLILGMGGSAIGGDILKSYLSTLETYNKIIFQINRNYKIPKYIDESWHVIVSSYSGNTEETLSGMKESLLCTKNIVCITTGGKVQELAIANDLPIILLPSGFQPRAALGYSFFPLLFLLMKNVANAQNSNDIITKSLIEMIVGLEKNVEYYTNLSSNLAIEIAESIQKTIPVIYSSSDILDTVNIRWRGQIQENSKNLAFGNFLPEMNHNEINSWTFPSDILDKFSIFLMRDIDDLERNQIRFEALKKVFENSIERLFTIQGTGDYLLTRIFDLIYLGDWVSYYLAILNEVDPTPIPNINFLKQFLAQN